MVEMKTYMGHNLNYDSLKIEKVDIKDIAHSLSLQCRFNGACDKFYSVAQHCVLVSREVEKKYKLWALLHDAAEAYCGDKIRPLKTEFDRQVENKFLEQIAEAFDLEMPIPKNVLDADNRMLLTEFNSLLIYRHKEVTPTSETDGFEPYKMCINPWSSYLSERIFLDRFNEIFWSK